MRGLLIIAVLAALAGCQLALPGQADRADTDSAVGAEVAANPITGGEIAVTALDDAGEGTPTPAQGAAQDAAAPVGTAEVEPRPAGEPTAQPLAEPVPAVEIAPPVAPVAVKTAAQLACETRRGVWSSTGSGKAAFCQTPTGDGGKSCRAASDCSGYCLAKSATCAPVTPLLGCHDIVDDAGRMLTQCIN